MDHLANECARKGYLTALEWLHVRKGIALSAKTMYAAALYGHRAMVVWLHDNKCPWDKAVYHIAQHRGFTSITLYMREAGFEDVAGIPQSRLPPPDFFGTSAICVSNSNTQLLSTEAPKELGYACVALNYIDILRGLVEDDNLPLDEFCCCIAAERGNVSMLAYLRDECKCPWDESALRGAVGAGQGHMIVYLLENDCPQYEISASCNTCVVS